MYERIGTMLTLYFGKGKGKTLCAIGATVKAAFKDKKILYVDFVNQSADNDTQALKSMYSVTVLTTLVDLELTADTAADSKAQASKVFRELFDTAVRTVLTNKYDMLVLDGIFDATQQGLLLDSEVYEFLSNAPDSLDVVCTGVNVDEKFIALATYASELTDKKETEENPS